MRRYLLGNPLVCQISFPPFILSSQIIVPSNFYTLPRCSGDETATKQPRLPVVEKSSSSGSGSNTSTPTWVIIVASVGTFSAVFAVLAVGVKAKKKTNRRTEEEGNKEKHQTVDDKKSDCVGPQTPVLSSRDLAKLKHAVLTRDPVVETKFSEEARDIIMGKAKAAAEGLETLLCVDSKETFYRRISLEVAGIEEEMRQFVRERRRRSLVNDFPYLEEMSNKELEEVREIFHYIVHEGTSEKKYPNGIRDQGRPPGTRLIDFVSHPKAVDAGLSAAHVVALRMYTSSIYKYLNSPLRDQARKEKRVACALPVTTWYVCHSRR
jgi:hypothetical protein